VFETQYFIVVLSVNPPPDRLGRENSILSGQGTSYYVPDFEGCLSVKSVLNGKALWETEGRRFLLNEDCCLVLNDRQRYTITIDSLRPVKTFCLFFERGFVEEIQRVHLTPCHALLEAPQPSRPRTIEFFTRIEPADTSLMGFLRRFYAELGADRISRTEWDLRFLRAGELLISGRTDTVSAISRLPAMRKSTRVELYRRVLRGRDFLLSCASEPIQLKDIASAACLSPFHFHRAFKRVFGETPHRYLTRSRLQRAAKLLRQGDLSVTEICFSAGFESLASFSSLFRSEYGVAPSKFSKIR
jgi:AraC family transcriptional regulator